MSTLPFFIIWNPIDWHSPSEEHATREIAEAEAHKLASENPGTKFYVCRVESYAEAPKPSATLVKLEEPTKQVTPQEEPEIGDGYRRLAKHEVLQVGDEWWCDVLGQWRATNHPGEGMEDYNDHIYRRRIGAHGA